MGTATGIRNGKAVHSDEIVRQARKLHREEGLNADSIGFMMGIAPPTVKGWITYQFRKSAGGYSEQNKV